MRKEQWPISIPDFDMTGKTVIVTGGTKGIGYAISMMFAYYGANVVISSRHQEECDSVVEEIVQLGGNAMGIRSDVCHIAEIENLITTAIKRFGAIDVLINNAGMALTNKILDVDEASYASVMDTNLKSVYFASKIAAREMMLQKSGGKIIQIASIGGLKGTSGLSTYGATKAAVINLTKTMALEWSRYNICVNAICPGYVLTKINEKEFESSKFRNHVLKQIPQHRLGSPDEIASIALFLASDGANMLTGEAIVADMGSTCG